MSESIPLHSYTHLETEDDHDHDHDQDQDLPKHVGDDYGEELTFKDFVSAHFSRSSIHDASGKRYVSEIHEPHPYARLQDDTDGEDDHPQSPGGTNISLPPVPEEFGDFPASSGSGKKSRGEKVAAWTAKELAMFRHLVHLDRSRGKAGGTAVKSPDPEEPFTSKPSHWRIPFGKSPFLRRVAPQKEVLIFSGPKSSLFDATVNLLKDNVGAGLLGFPLAFAWSGSLLMGLFLLLLTVLNAFSANLLVKSAYHTKVASYNEIAEKAYGRKLSVAVDLLTITLDFGSVVAYEVLIGDFACTLSNAMIGSCRRPVVVFGISLILVLPLCLLPTVNALKYPSMLSTIFIFFFAAVIIVESIQFMIANGGPHPSVFAVGLSFNTFRALTVGCFSYSCHVTVLPIFSELERPSGMNGYRFVNWTFAMSMILYFLVGFFGFLTYGTEVQGNILNNVPKDDIGLVLIACFMFAIVVNYPLTNVSMRISIDYLLFAKQYHSKSIKKSHQNLRMALYSCVMLIISAFIGAYVTDVGPVFSLTGSITTTLLTLVFPSLIFLRLRKKGILRREKTRTSDSFLTAMSTLAIVLGISVGVLGFVIEILHAAGVVS